MKTICQTNARRKFDPDGQACAFDTRAGTWAAAFFGLRVKPWGLYCGRMNANARWFCWILPLGLLLLLCSCDLHQKLAQLHFNQGMKKLGAGDDAGALDDFSAAVAQDPQFAEAYLYRGISYLSLSNFTTALKDFDKATELSPGD